MNRLDTMKRVLERFVFSKYPQYDYKFGSNPNSPNSYEIIVPVDHKLYNAASSDYDSNYWEFINEIEDLAAKSLKIVGLEDEWVEPRYTHLNKDVLKNIVRDVMEETNLKSYDVKLKVNDRVPDPDIRITRKDGKPLTGNDDINLRKVRAKSSGLDGFRVLY